ncbi:HNH endonuclease family protein [Desulfonema limicola]|uniref:HNH endonuclease family protein n=1 Tax=Desulfonema limicola TaxID=45656 RepID=A0A975B3X1_9BACT|nr:HNH endonuclease [Desulfonema limicola]QTA78318.1 HNH endonuclease family protein [Desulfonema limicola]
MDNTFIKEKFRNLTVWKSGSQRAPHKPLLILYAIGRLLKDSERMIPYAEVDAKLTELLIAFGPYRKQHHPEAPFWRLKNDQIWDLKNADKVEETKGKDAKKPHLLKYNVQGGFPEDIYNRLKQDFSLVKEIVQELLNDNFPATIHEDILMSVGIDMEYGELKRKRDPEFREKILRAYDYRCAVCGFDVRLGHYPVALEAAHIKWHQAGGPDTEVNGLALCSLHHKLFDRGAFTLSDNLEILISDRAYGTTGFNEWLMRFHGNKINAPQSKTYLPDNSFRNWHLREVFQGEFRDKKFCNISKI